MSKVYHLCMDYYKHKQNLSCCFIGIILYYIDHKIMINSTGQEKNSQENIKEFSDTIPQRLKLIMVLFSCILSL